MILLTASISLLFIYAFCSLHRINNMYIEECKRANKMADETWRLYDKNLEPVEDLDKMNKKYAYLKNKK